MSWFTKKKQYRYTSIYKNTKNTGTIQASSQSAAKQILSNSGHTILNLSRLYAFNLTTWHLPPYELLNFTKNIIQTLKSSIPISQILHIIIERQSSTKIKNLYQHIHNKILSGQSLSDAFKEFPQHFPTDYCALILAGEQHGNLTQTLQYAHKLITQQYNTKQHIKKSLQYPCITLAVSSILIISMVLFIVPQFQQMYHQLGGTLPKSTLILLNIIHQLNYIIPSTLTSLLLLAAIFKMIIKHFPPLQIKLYKMYLYIPKLGTLLRYYTLAKWLQILGSLLQSSVDFVTALNISRQIFGSPYLLQQASLCQSTIQDGKKLSESLSNVDLCLANDITFIEIGECTGEVGAALLALSDNYQHFHQQAIQQFIRLLEPLIMVILALGLGAILIILYLPLFKLGKLF